MARTESRIKTSIWAPDSDFRELSGPAQLLYFKLISQPTISLCGVLAYTPARWANSTGGWRLEDVDRAIAELERAGKVVRDTETEEVLVRSFVRNDGVWSSEKTRKAARSQLATIASARIRRFVEAEMRRASGEPPDDDPGHGLSDGVSDTPSPRAPQPRATESGVVIASPGANRAKAQRNTPSDIPSDPVSHTPPDRPRVRAHAVSSLQSPSPSTSIPSVRNPHDDLAEATWRWVAVNRLAEREAGAGPVANRDAWLRKVVSELRLAHQAQARAMLDDDRERGYRWGHEPAREMAWRLGIGGEDPIPSPDGRVCFMARSFTDPSLDALLRPPERDLRATSDGGTSMSVPWDQDLYGPGSPYGRHVHGEVPQLRFPARKRLGGSRVPEAPFQALRAKGAQRV